MDDNITFHLKNKIRRMTESKDYEALKYEMEHLEAHYKTIHDRERFMAIQTITKLCADFHITEATLKKCLKASKKEVETC